MSTAGLVDTKQPKRRQYSETLKRQMVTETLAPRASVSIVARRHDLNANQLLKWRRAKALEQPPVTDASGTTVPVEIVAASAEPQARARRTGTIEITFACAAVGSWRGVG